MTTITSKHPQGSICWFDMMSKDVEKMRQFYGRLFDWSFDIGPAETGFYTMCKTQGKNVVGMGQDVPDAKTPPAWNVYFATDDLDQTITKIQELGGHVLMPAMDVMEQGRMAFCSDPTGAGFGLWQAKQHTGAQLRDEPGSMTWAEVHTNEPKKARDFYCAVFGLRAEKLEEPNLKYYSLHCGDKAVGGVSQRRGDANVPPHWIPYFAVSDADATAKRAADGGGKVVTPCFDTPWGRMAVLLDPSGAAFSIIKNAPH